LSLTIPLPFLSQLSLVAIPGWLLWLGIGLGGVIIVGVLSEKVILNEEEIKVSYPQWINWFSAQGWSLSWREIKELKMRTTGQGGLVYYLITHQQDRAYLLPMRVAGFAQMVKIVTEKTGIDTTDIRPLPQPWMYITLLILSLFLLLIDTWIIVLAVNHSRILIS
jgi:hypothetical protein